MYVPGPLCSEPLMCLAAYVPLSVLSHLRTEPLLQSAAYMRSPYVLSRLYGAPYVPSRLCTELAYVLSRLC
jgi:hypothetical protein